ncbi:MAG: hypothetical protein KDD55_13390 [Bdellovibrionales bacterium]|nr:hypothetical protein [Bdellovibrionales bacterium]
MLRLFLTLLSCVLFSASAFALVPSVSEITDNRTTGQFFAGLKLKVQLVGDEMNDVKGIRYTLKKAVDETGRDLIDPEKLKNEFQPYDQQSWNQKYVELELKNPSRKSATIQELSGEIVLYMPSKDPNAKIEFANALSQSGKPLQHKALSDVGVKMTVYTKAAYDKKKADAQAKQQEQAKGIQGGMQQAFQGMFGFMSMNENDIAFEIDDPNGRIVSYAFYDSTGNEVRRSSWMTSGELRVTSFQSAVPADAKLVIELATPKSVMNVPLALNNVALP